MALEIKTKLQRLLRYLAADTPFSKYKTVFSLLMGLLAGVAGYLFDFSLESATAGIGLWFLTLLTAVWLWALLFLACTLTKEGRIWSGAVSYVIGNLGLGFWLQVMIETLDGGHSKWPYFFETPFYVIPWFVIPWLVISAAVPLLLAWTRPWGALDLPMSWPIVWTSWILSGWKTLTDLRNGEEEALNSEERKYLVSSVFEKQLIGRMVFLALMVPMAYFVWYDLSVKEAHRWLLIEKRAESIEYARERKEWFKRPGLKHESVYDRLALEAEKAGDLAKAAQYRFLNKRRVEEESRFKKWLLGDTERLVSELEELTGERFGELEWMVDLSNPYKGMYAFPWLCTSGVSTIDTSRMWRPSDRTVWHPPDYNRVTVIQKALNEELSEDALKALKRLEQLESKAEQGARSIRAGARKESLAKVRGKGPQFFIYSYECRHQVYERKSILRTILKGPKL